MNNNQPPAVPANMTRSAHQAFADPHLKAADLPAAGATYKIKSVQWKALRPQLEWEFKPIVWFTTPSGLACSKYLILNKTQSRAITAIACSDDFDAWVGHLVHLSPARARGQDTIAVSPAPADIAAKYAAKPDPSRLREPVSRDDF
jgi:hypothetical protein